MSIVLNNRAYRPNLAVILLLDFIKVTHPLAPFKVDIGIAIYNVSTSTATSNKRTNASKLNYNGNKDHYAVLDDRELVYERLFGAL